MAARKERTRSPKEQEFLEHLLELGLISEIKPLPPTDMVDTWRPIAIEGRPISEEIIEDRR